MNAADRYWRVRIVVLLWRRLHGLISQEHAETLIRAITTEHQ